MRLLYTTILILATIGSQGYGGKVLNKVVVFWIPPEVQTYVPVTGENIEQRAFKIVSIKNERQADQVLSLIQRSSQSLDSNEIRIKIVNNDIFYICDKHGVGISSTHEAVKIDIPKLKQVLCE